MTLFKDIPIYSHFKAQSLKTPLIKMHTCTGNAVSMDTGISFRFVEKDEVSKIDEPVLSCAELNNYLEMHSAMIGTRCTCKEGAPC